MFTKLPRFLSRVSVRTYTNKIPHITMNNPKWLENQVEAARLEGIEQAEWQQNCDTYSKVKNELDLQASEQPPVKQTMSPKEAAGKVLDDAFSNMRQHLGDSFTNSIEHPLRSYSFPKFEKIFTYLAKDGRVDKDLVNNCSKYGLYLIAALASLYIYEQITSYKDEISKLEKEIQELEKQYTAKNFTHSDIREQIIKKQNHLLAKNEQLAKYLEIMEALEEAKAGIVNEAEDRNFIERIKDQFFSILNSDGYEKVKAKSFLRKQNKDSSVVKEIDKWASVDVALMVAEEHVSKINKKCNNLQNTIAQLEQKLDVVGEQVVQIGEKLEDKQSQLKNKWGYSFFNQITQETDEAPAAEQRLEI
ncbi:hypothetical protein Lgra_3388 [Legionella gratiana]|uniref:Uncharacterized protein n=1 Tax=Legionella gratiana TaxID=45066 RepID=A0A378JC82_9GAMM|nr:hypothetical protein [Legionella gratiana]KTD05511.1 hypothetical protein Lgra_3388 [Legionella gratiana]STX45413.1 Uncharacterised protein [Legionella gratiana]